jgi:hypothetical protein
MLEAAKGLPDLLKARREAMEARWRGEMASITQIRRRQNCQPGPMGL